MLGEYLRCKSPELDYKHMEVKNRYATSKCFEGLAKDGKTNRYLLELLAQSYLLKTKKLLR